MMDEENVETQQGINQNIEQAFQKAKKDEDEPQRAYPAYDTLELYEKVLINTPQSGKKPFKELEPYLATAYLDEKELHALKRIHSVLSNGEYILEMMKENLERKHKDKKEEMDISQVTEQMIRKMFFISYVSKSKNGFTVLELNSQHTYQHQNLYQKQAFEEEEGMLDNLKDKMQGVTQKVPKKEGKYLPDKKSDEIW